MRKLAALAFGVICFLSTSSWAVSGNNELCDQLASEDAARAPVVRLDDIEPDLATAACVAALAADPANAGLLHQYARALEKAGRLDDARRLYDWAASDGYPPAIAAKVRLSGLGTVPSEWPATERQTLGAEMATVASALRRYGRQFPTDPSDTLAILAETGTEPNAILTWVAAHTRSAAYVGSLRGPQGVLADRTGNSLDRTLLLSMLLSQAGQEVRIAHTTLDLAKAQALLPATERAVDVPKLPTTTREQFLAQFADANLPVDQLAVAATAVNDREARTTVMLVNRTAALLPVLLAAAQPFAEQADAAIRDAALSALADHFWIQIRVGNGWRDLDPDAALLGPEVPFETLAVADLPTSLRHAVTLRVVLELQDPAGRREEQLLSHTVYPADDGAATLTLSHASKGLDALQQLLAAPDLPKRTVDLLDAVSAWTPILRTGTDIIVDHLFTSDGELRNANVSVFSQAGASIGNLFDDVGSVLSGEDPTPRGTVIPTAEWLEIEVAVPGATPRVERRTIFDLLGPADRASGLRLTMTQALARSRAVQLLGPIDILVTGASPSPITVAHTGAATAAAIADNILTFTTMPEDTNVADLSTGRRVSLTLLRFASRRLLRTDAPNPVSPGVFLLHDRFGWDPSAGATRAAEFDIVFNDVAGTGFVNRVLQGLVDTIIEQAVVEDVGLRNASALHSRDEAAGRPWHVLSATDAAELAQFTPDVRERIESDLGAGYIVIAPTLRQPSPGDEAWWRIDPRTGTTLGMMPSGGGATLVEYGKLVFESASAGACFAGIGMAINTMVTGAGHGVRKGIGLCLIAAGGGIVGSGVGLIAGGANVIAILIAYGVTSAAG